MSQNLLDAAVFLVHALFGLYLILVLVRLLMQVARADYYNPICQAVVKLTDPPIKPLKRLLPTVRGVDFATLLVALLVQIVIVCIVMGLKHGYFFHPIYIAWSLVGVASSILDVYLFAIFIMVIASWVAPYSNHPVTTLVYQITEPIIKPMRQIIPPMGGLDLSVFFVALIILLLENFLLIVPLAVELGIPGYAILGLY